MRLSLAASLGSLLALPPRAAVLRHGRVVCTDASWQLVTSRSNARLKLVKKLQTRRQREKSDLLLLEGHRLVMDAVDVAGLEPEFFVVHDDALTTPAGIKLAAVLRRFSPEKVVRAPADLIAELSDTESPQGVLAVVPQQPRPLPPNPSLVLVCDAVSDPGNMGTLLRSAAGAGVGACLLAPGCCDPWGLKALRAGMGAQFRMPVHSVASWADASAQLGRWGCAVLAADAGGVESHFEVNWNEASALVVGSEAHGLSEEVRNDPNVRLCRIPLGQAELPSNADGVESLNAAVAGSVILFEAQRQRLQAK